MSNTNPVWLSDHHTPRRSDTELVVLQKTLGAIIDGGGGSSGGGGNIGGSGAPVAAPSDPTLVWQYTNFDDGTQYTWNPNTNSWE